jgi:hypothetical protein
MTVFLVLPKVNLICSRICLKIYNQSPGINWGILFFAIYYLLTQLLLKILPVLFL